MSDTMKTRRSMMLGVGAAAVAAGISARPADAQTPGAFQPSRHPEDAWLDQRAGTHRILIDAATAHGAGEAFLYANNLFTAQKSAYAGGADADLALVVVLRHFAAAFAYTDAIWAKYGGPLGAAVSFTDPKTKQAPATNLYNKTGYGLSLPNLGTTIDGVTKRGAYFAVCDTATHFLASQTAAAMGGGDAAAIYKEFAANLIANSRLVPNGVMAVTRSQEHGYSLLYAG
jgi:hypothetical protein